MGNAISGKSIRTIQVGALASVAVLALSACAPAEQSVREACDAVQEHVDEAGATREVMLDAGRTADAVVVRDAWAAFHEGLVAGREDITNEQVQVALDRMIEPLPVTLDGLNEVDDIMELPTEGPFQMAGEEFNEAREAYSAICAPES